MWPWAQGHWETSFTWYIALCLPLPSEETGMSPSTPACTLLPGLGGQRTEGKPSPDSAQLAHERHHCDCHPSPRRIPANRLHSLTSCLDVRGGFQPQRTELLVPEDWTTRTSLIHSGSSLQCICQHLTLKSAQHQGL